MLLNTLGIQLRGHSSCQETSAAGNNIKTPECQWVSLCVRRAPRELDGRKNMGPGRDGGTSCLYPPPQPSTDRLTSGPAGT